MVHTEDGRKIEDADLKELHQKSIDHLLYAHGDVWRGQQFYTSLNTTIIGFAVVFIRLGSSGPQYASVILFVAGAITSLFGLLTVRKLRIYYLNAYYHKAMLDHLLGHHSKLVDDKVKGRTLAVGWSHIATDEELSKPEKAVRRDIWRKGGVTFYFMVLQIAFLGINIVAAALVLAGIV